MTKPIGELIAEMVCDLMLLAISYHLTKSWTVFLLTFFVIWKLNILFRGTK